MHYLGVPEVIPTVFIKRTQKESVREEGKVAKVAQVGVRSFEDGGNVQKPMNTGIH